MKLVSVNIELNKHDDLVLKFLKKENPDVICIQELLEEKFVFYKKELNREGIFQSCRFERDFSVNPTIAGKKLGVAIFAKDILKSGSMFYLGKEEEISKPFNSENFEKTEALVWANIKNDDGETYKFVTAHLPVTKHGESTPFQLETLDLLLNKLDTLGEFIFCGDMNAPRGNETFNRLAKKYKDNIPLEYKTSIDQNLHRVKGIQFMVDGLFTTPAYNASNVKLVDGVSDHMAIIAEINKS